MAAAGVIGTGTHNTGIKHGILPTQVRRELGECQCMDISILRASGRCPITQAGPGVPSPGVRTLQAGGVLCPRDGAAVGPTSSAS